MHGGGNAFLPQGGNIQWYIMGGDRRVRNVSEGQINDPWFRLKMKMQEKINLGIWLTSDNTASQVPAVATEKKGHCLGRKLASADTDLYSDSENRGKTLGGCDMKRFTWWRMEQNPPHNARERWCPSCSILHHVKRFISQSPDSLRKIEEPNGIKWEMGAMGSGNYGDLSDKVQQIMKNPYLIPAMIWREKFMPLTFVLPFSYISIVVLVVSPFTVATCSVSSITN